MRKEDADRLILWDTANKKQIDDAKMHYRNARQEGRIVASLDHINIEHFDPNSGGFIIKQTELAETEFAMRILDETGDRRLIWNASDPDQVKECVALFDEYVSKGWRCYSIDASGNTRRRIHRFDIEKEEVFFEEKTSEEIIGNFAEIVKKEKAEESKKKDVLKSEKILNFIKSFKNTKLIPRTYPG